MATQTDNTAGMDIAHIVAAFSDYDGRVIRIGVTALESTVEHYEDNLWPAVDALLVDDEKWTAVKVDTLNDRAKRHVAAARKAGADIVWTMTTEKLADVLRVRANHTAARLATYEAYAVTESTRKGAKRTAAVTMTNYASFLREIVKGDRDEDGALTKQGKDAAAKREREQKAMATATVDMGGVDWDRDLAALTDEQKLETFLRWETNLKVRIAELKESVGSDKAGKVAAKVTDARKQAAGIKKS